MFSFQRLFPTALLAAALAGPALAQTAPADTARTYRHQLGLTASPQLAHFFTANRSLPVGLIYKQQVKNQFLRLRLVGFYNRRDTASANHPLFQPLNSSGPDARRWEANAFIGYEWQHTLSRRFRWTYGLEAGAGYHHEYLPFNLQEYSTGGSTSGNPYVITTTGSRYVHRWQIQGRAFAGFSYLLGSRLTLFAETALLLTYENQKRGGEYSASFSNGLPTQVGGSFYDIRLVVI